MKKKIRVMIADKPEYPFPHRHIPIEGGHITVDPRAPDDLIDALKRLAEKARVFIDNEPFNPKKP